MEAKGVEALAHGVGDCACYSGDNGSRDYACYIGDSGMIVAVLTSALNGSNLTSKWQLALK